MITYPVQFPAIRGMRSVGLRARSTVSASASPFTGQEQVYVHSGEWWEHDLELPPMQPADAETLVGFLLSLNGRQGTFLMRDWAYRRPRGAALGAPVVNGAGQSGKTLLTRNWNASVTNVLLPGDEIQLGSGSLSRLHKVVAAVNSDAGGLATLEIWPRIREAQADGAAIITETPQSVWRLASNETAWNVGLAQIYGLRIVCREAL